MVAHAAKNPLANLIEDKPATSAISTTSSLAPAPTLAPIASDHAKECLDSAYPWNATNPILEIRPPGQCVILALGQRRDANRTDESVSGKDAFEPCCKDAYDISGLKGQVGCFCKGGDCTNTTKCLSRNQEAMLVNAVYCTPPEKGEGRRMLEVRGGGWVGVIVLGLLTSLVCF